jgi:DNA-directed RNA polymerase specialized sigma subunit
MKDDPIDDYLSEREKIAAQRKAEDVRLWQAWKQQPNPQLLEPLLQRFEPMIQQHVRKYKAPNIQESALRANLQKQAIEAFETYDPNRAALSTHVMGRLRKGLRFTRLHQNLARIPEAKAEKIGPIQSAQDELADQFGRPPTPDEIASHLGTQGVFRKPLTGQQVLQIQQSQVKDIPASTFESDPTPFAAAREREVLGLLRPSLKIEEQAVFDHLFGLNGKQRLTSTGEIAKKLGKSPSQVSRLKGRIESQYKKYV